MSKNDNLQKARKVKDDEFYTQMEDIEKEILDHFEYVDFLKGKTVLCNCDDPEYSNFFNFFVERFRELSLKKLITTHYNKDGSPSYKIEYTGGISECEPVFYRTPLEGNGDFRSEECLEILKEADVVITNPPFSLFRDYLLQLFKYEKKFLIVGSKNSVSTKDVFPYFSEGKMSFGYNSIHSFKKPDGSFKKFGNIGWYTNIPLKKTAEKVPFCDRDISEYKTYDNYPRAVNVGRVSDLPDNYFGEMGVPVSFLEKYNPEQFTLVGSSQQLAKPVVINGRRQSGRFYLDGKRLYERIVIKRKKEQEDS